MYKEGHHGLNALLYTPIFIAISFLYSVEVGIVGAIAFVGVSSIPDIDRHFDSGMNSHRSDIWHIIPIKHRGFTHTIWFGAIVGGLGAGLVIIMLETYAPGAVPVLIGGCFGFFCGFGGVMGHLLGDVVTPAGIRPFSPLSRTRYSLGLFTAANQIINYLFLCVGGGVLMGTIAWVVVEKGIAIDEIEYAYLTSQLLLGI